MKIIWNENPLQTSVILDEYDHEVFKLKLYIDQLENHLVGCHFYLSDGEFFNLEKAKEEAAVDFDNIKLKVDQNFDYLVKELEFGTHMGDCTCVPCSCEKCHAEDLLGINTIEGLGKHSAYKIDSLFHEVKTIDNVLESLYNYEPKANWDGAEVYFDRWKQEAKHAYEWLKKYKEEHNL